MLFFGLCTNTLSLQNRIDGICNHCIECSLHLRLSDLQVVILADYLLLDRVGEDADHSIVDHTRLRPRCLDRCTISIIMSQISYIICLSSLCSQPLSCIFVHYRASIVFSDRSGNNNISIKTSISSYYRPLLQISCCLSTVLRLRLECRD